MPATSRSRCYAPKAGYDGLLVEVLRRLILVGLSVRHDGVVDRRGECGDAQEGVESFQSPWNPIESIKSATAERLTRHCLTRQRWSRGRSQPPCCFTTSTS